MTITKMLTCIRADEKLPQAERTNVKINGYVYEREQTARNFLASCVANPKLAGFIPNISAAYPPNCSNPPEPFI
jgi:hypothetical protein